jgi:hypothetical protein
VNAHIHADYDRLLSAGWDRHEARAHVRAAVEQTVKTWSHP